MADTKSKKFPLRYFIILLAIIILIILMSITMAGTSTTDYCTSCHEMKIYKEELAKSSHAADKDKNPIQCKQCHIPGNIGPKYLIVKTYFGSKDIIAHNFGNPENLNRRDMQKIARRFIPDENCIACHSDLTKNSRGDKISKFGKLCHEAYLKKNGTTKRGCAGCHFNMAHLPRFDRRYFFNAQFAKRLPIKKEQK